MSEQSNEDFRIEHDSMGEVRVPRDAKWRAQTQRAVENFPISGPAHRAGAHRGARPHQGARRPRSTPSSGVLDADVAQAIQDAAAEVAAASWDEHFPIDVFQTGSGTSSNMNTNEVLATIATEKLGRPVHPNDHVNASQSSNDVFPPHPHRATSASSTTSYRARAPRRVAGAQARRVRPPS
jgi:fumarate hydratase class II